MNDTNEKIYEEFEMVINEMMTPSKIIEITQEQINKKNFIAVIEVKNIKFEMEQGTYNRWYEIEFEPITLKFPPEEVKTTEGEYWSQSETEYRKRDDVIVTSAKYCPIGVSQVSQLSNIKKAMMAGKPAIKKVKFLIRWKWEHERQIPVIDNITTLLSR